MAPRLQFVAYSDYLCPWCANGSLRLHRLEDEYAGDIAIEWRSYLLRPYPRKPARDELHAAERLEKFRRYTQSWLRPAADEDAFDFRLWDEDNTAGPPSHSIPAHVAAKAAREAGGAPAFRAMHDALLQAYFHDNRDISDEATVRDLWAVAGLSADAFPVLDERDAVMRVVDEHNEAVQLGVSGVPAVRMVGNDAVVVGAQSMELYRRWVDRALAKLDAAEEGA